MNRTNLVVCGILLLLVGVSGCCGRLCSNCGTGTAAGGILPNWDGFGNARVAPPATGTYQVPTAQQPYYTPSATASVPTGSAFNPNILSGPPATTIQPGFGQPTNTQPVIPQQGWRPTDAPTGSGFYGPTAQPTSGNFNSTSYQPSFQPMAPDYRSTVVDERLDPTRMPATDATMVRAPTSFNPTGNWPSLNQMASSSINVPGRFEYRTTPQIASQPYAATGQMNPTQLPPLGFPSYPYATQSQPVVLAQASTSPELLARDPNYQAGWRDRYTAGTYLNR